MKGLVAQSSITLCDPMDCSPPGSSVHGILQARILEWVAIPFSRGSSPLRGSSLLRDQTQVFLHGRQILHHLSHQREALELGLWSPKGRGLKTFAGSFQ